MLRREDLKDCMKPIDWLLPVFGIILVVLSPIILPIGLIIRHFNDDVKCYYEECWEAVSYNPWRK